MKSLFLAVALLLTAVVTPADQILTGVLKLPNEIIDYNLTADTMFHSGFGGYYETTLSGVLLFSYANGQLFSTWNISNDMWVFGVNDTMTMMEFGAYSHDDPPVLIHGYDFVTNAQGVQVVFTNSRSLTEFSETSRAVAEPSVLMMLLAGLALVRCKKRYK